jgi:hypothetical protein
VKCLLLCSISDVLLWSLKLVSYRKERQQERKKNDEMREEGNEQKIFYTIFFSELLLHEMENNVGRSKYDFT